MERRPFPQVMRKLLDENDISERQLALAVRKKGGPHQATINVNMRGEYPPTMKTCEAIAKHFGKKPEIFAEYELAKAREALDPDVVGFNKAVRSLERFEAGSR